MAMIMQYQIHFKPDTRTVTAIPRCLADGRTYAHRAVTAIFKIIVISKVHVLATAGQMSVPGSRIVGSNPGRVDLL